MKKYNQIKERMRPYLAAGMAAAICFGTVPVLKAQEAKPDSADKKGSPQTGQPATSPDNKQPLSGASAKDATNKKARPVPRQLSGAEIYSMHCARCHPERYPNERTSAQWKTIAMHMRVRANLPAEHVKKVLKYLQDNSGY